MKIPSQEEKQIQKCVVQTLISHPGNWIDFESKQFLEITKRERTYSIIDFLRAEISTRPPARKQRPDRRIGDSSSLFHHCHTSHVCWMNGRVQCARKQRTHTRKKNRGRMYSVNHDRWTTPMNDTRVPHIYVWQAAPFPSPLIHRLIRNVGE